MYNIILAWISVKQQFFSAKNAKAVSVLLRFPCEISQEKSWDFPRIPENHWQEFPENYFALICTLPSPSTAFSQSLSVSSFRWRIRGERAGNTHPHFRKDHVTRNALAARKNEA